MNKEANTHQNLGVITLNDIINLTNRTMFSSPGMKNGVCDYVKQKCSSMKLGVKLRTVINCPHTMRLFSLHKAMLGLNALVEQQSLEHDFNQNYKACEP